MSKTIRMDASGRIVVPLAVRERYGLADGAYNLELHEGADGILLRPELEEIPADRHESGWVVFRSEGEEVADPSDVVERDREARHRALRGDTDRTGS